MRSGPVVFVAATVFLGAAGWRSSQGFPDLAEAPSVTQDGQLADGPATPVVVTQPGATDASQNPPESGADTEVTVPGDEVDSAGPLSTDEPLADAPSTEPTVSVLDAAPETTARRTTPTTVRPSSGGNPVVTVAPPATVATGNPDDTSPDVLSQTPIPDSSTSVVATGDAPLPIPGATTSTSTTTTSTLPSTTTTSSTTTTTTTTVAPTTDPPTTAAATTDPPTTADPTPPAP